jgi:hypothetical protein
MVDAHVIKVEADCKRIAFLQAAARDRAGRDAQAPAAPALTRPSARLRAAPAGATASGRASRVRYPVWGWIGGLLGRPA